MADMVNITIDGKLVTVPSDYTVLKAAEEAGIYIPRLCFLEGIHEASSCRVCVVEIEKQRTLKNACTMPINEGMVVRTNTPKVKDAVKRNLELLAANHKFECWKCVREDNCEFLSLLRRYDIANAMGEDKTYARKPQVINDSVAMTLDSSKCLLCGRCISTCEKVAGTGVLAFNQRGSKTVVGPAGLNNLEDAGCIFCGKCIQACPTGAIREHSAVNDVIECLNDENKYVVVQAAPAVRVALGEEFGLPIGTNVEGKMYAAFERLGFDQIADVNWGADLTIMEEGTELINRIKEDGQLPLFTSCSPGWIRFIEHYAPEFIPNLSSAKSPHMMSGAMIKHYWAGKLGVDPKSVVVVSIMPCVAKKYESARPEMEEDGLRDVDYVLTTRELARLIKRKGINFNALEDVKPQGQLAQFTGAGNIFGATGGVMEAALRTVAEKLVGKKLTKLDFEMVRGNKDIKEASLKLGDLTLNVAVVHGGAAIKEFIDILRTTTKKYHFVEFMGCTGGCVNGGGQPIVSAEVLAKTDVRSLRAKALYDEDKKMTLRQSHLNKDMMCVYEEFLGEPCSEVAHKYLHTHYSAKNIFENYE